jgi:hypothetical protein
MMFLIQNISHVKDYSSDCSDNKHLENLKMIELKIQNKIAFYVRLLNPHKSPAGRSLVRIVVRQGINNLLSREAK